MFKVVLKNAREEKRNVMHVSSNFFKIIIFIKDTLFNISPAVLAKLKYGDPVVALESTIITHGMPYPENYKTALAVEKIVEETGATPATIAVMKGKVCIGLEKQKLQDLASSSELMKISRRDLPYVISQNCTGGTTVSATMLLAHRVGIPIFATGGIGGVHRDVDKSMDISTDLTELGRTPIAVVSAGVKSILDVRKTLEFLETQGVCVLTLGQTREFPAFFTPRSNCYSPHNVSSPEEAAKLIAAAQNLNLESGILLTVAIPNEFSADGNEIEAAIQQSLKEASASGIGGKDVTPFILNRVNELTEGKSLAASKQLTN
uniref:Pseudouridine-5'-phosphate glycosidase n=1 Tax=Strigamia maritima TaxID=126957 RepID=T1J6S7_STRMM